MIQYLQKLAAYDQWANQQVLESLRTIPAEAPPAAKEKAATLMGHLAAAKRVWLNRMVGKPAGTDPWPKLTLDAADEMLAKADKDFLTLTSKLTLTKLAQPVIYRTFKGQSHATPLVDVVVHIINHGSYHRGQLANAIATAGGTAAATDYIVWARR